jgi:hypothetical protein
MSLIASSFPNEQCPGPPAEASKDTSSRRTIGPTGVIGSFTERFQANSTTFEFPAIHTNGLM